MFHLAPFLVGAAVGSAVTYFLKNSSSKPKSTASADKAGEDAKAESPKPTAN